MLDLLFVRRYSISKLVCSKIFEFIHFSLVLLFQNFELSIVLLGKFFSDSNDFFINLCLVSALGCLKLVSQLSHGSLILIMSDFFYKFLNLFLFCHNLFL